jgi:thiosulfate/3-mercaptopyruvate sulfurtransferase
MPCHPPNTKALVTSITDAEVIFRVAAHSYFAHILRDEFFLPAAELAEVLDAQGLLRAPRALIYCGGGIAATLDGFACALMGQQNVGVYDGSMSEWVADQSLPLTLGTQP